MAWNKGDYVVHRRDGICRITDIAELNLSKDGPRMYYILTPLYETGSRLYTPFEQGDQQLRDPLKAEEIEYLISMIPGFGSDWIGDEKERQRHLTEIVRNGSHESLLKAIHTLYEKRREQAQAGRKFHASDERFLGEAEKSVNREFAFVLGMAPEDIPEYIRSRLEKSK